MSEFSIPSAARANSAAARLLLCDDHPAILGLAAVALTGVCSIIGAVVDGHQLLEAAEQLQPDVIVLDISMPGVNGIKAAQELQRSHPAIKLIFLTVHEDADFARAGFAAGALGYVVKSRLASDLVAALHAALAGTRFLSSTVRLDDQA